MSRLNTTCEPHLASLPNRNIVRHMYITQRSSLVYVVIPQTPVSRNAVMLLSLVMKNWNIHADL